MENIKIRKVNLNDIEQLQTLSKQTFFETFSAANTADNMEKYLDEGFGTEKLIAELNDPATEFYFAELGENIIGYLKLNTNQAQTELRHENALEIERIYVLKEFYGKKVGQVLLKKAIDVAREKKVGFVWLGVWDQNHRAIAFYKKNGFVAFDQHVFRLGNEEQTDLMMKLEDLA